LGFLWFFHQKSQFLGKKFIFYFFAFLTSTGHRLSVNLTFISYCPFIRGKISNLNCKKPIDIKEIFDRKTAFSQNILFVYFYIKIVNFWEKV